jgi:hypothetical protein
MTIRIRLHRAVQHACRARKDRGRELRRVLRASDHCGNPARTLRLALVAAELAGTHPEYDHAIVDRLRQAVGRWAQEIL